MGFQLSLLSSSAAEGTGGPFDPVIDPKGREGRYPREEAD